MCSLVKKFSDADSRYSVFYISTLSSIWHTGKQTYLSPPNADISWHMYPSMIVSGLEKIPIDKTIFKFMASKSPDKCTNHWFIWTLQFKNTWLPHDDVVQFILINNLPVSKRVLVLILLLQIKQSMEIVWYLENRY